MASERGRVSEAERDPRWLLGSLTLATFVASASTISITPFLLDLARDLSSNLAAVSGLVAAQNLTWGVGSLAAGLICDRVGRKPVLLGGLLVLGATSLGVASATSFGWVAAWRALGGVFGGAFISAAFTAASDLAPPAGRGRALGWIMVGQSLSLVLGVPLLTLFAAFGGWRGALAVHAGVSLVAALPIGLLIPGGRGARLAPAVPAREVLRLVRPRVAALLVSSTLERVCYCGVVVFLPTFLLTTYGVSLQVLAVALALVSVGNLVGNVLGGQLSDRLPARPLTFGASMTAAGALALPLLFWHPAMALSVGLGFAYTLVNALGRPALFASISTVSNEARGSILGLNITFTSWGWILATGAGGWLIAGPTGFGGLGMLTLAAGVLGAALAVASWVGAQRVPQPAAIVARSVPAQSTAAR